MGAVDFVVLVWIRVDEGPNNFLIRSNLDENPVPSGADKGIIVEHPLSTPKTIRKQVIRQHILPGQIIRAIRPPRWEIVFTSLIVYIRGDFINA